MENNFWLGMIWILDIAAIVWAASVVLCQALLPALNHSFAAI